MPTGKKDPGRNGGSYGIPCRCRLPGSSHFDVDQLRIHLHRQGALLDRKDISREGN